MNAHSPVILAVQTVTGPCVVVLPASAVPLRPEPFYPWPASMPAPSRAEIEAMVEGLIEYLDREDGDPDLEPALASREVRDWESQILWAGGGSDDRENAECDDCDGEHVPVVDPRYGVRLSAGRR